MIYLTSKYEKDVTWRSTNAVQAGAELSAAFDFNVPIRWSIAQLYQSVLDGEAYVKDIALKILSDMLGIPVTTRATAGEGGAWGIAELAGRLRMNAR